MRVILNDGELRRHHVRADVDCPRCGAPRDADCIGRRGRRHHLHRARWLHWTQTYSHRVVAVLRDDPPLRVQQLMRFRQDALTPIDELFSMPTATTVLPEQGTVEPDAGAQFAHLLDCAGTTEGDQ